MMYCDDINNAGLAYKGEGAGNLGYLLTKSEINYTGSYVCVEKYTYAAGVYR